MNDILRIMALQNTLHTYLMYRDRKLAAIANDHGDAYESLSEISRHIELLTADLRQELIDCHDELQAAGCRPRAFFMPNTPDIAVKVDQSAVRILVGGMLPFPIKGSAHFLHEKLDALLTQYSRENRLPKPLFEERCAVVFFHHYATDQKATRNMRDYDNTERRCITNVIARHFLRDDSPACYISMDILAPGDRTFTEIRLMTISAFRALVLSDQIEYCP